MKHIRKSSVQTKAQIIAPLGHINSPSLFFDIRTLHSSMRNVAAITKFSTFWLKYKVFKSILTNCFYCSSWHKKIYTVHVLYKHEESKKKNCRLRPSFIFFKNLISQTIFKLPKHSKHHDQWFWISFILFNAVYGHFVSLFDINIINSF